MRVWLLCSSLFFIVGYLSPTLAASGAEALTSENIASSTLRVAQATHTTGYCYAAVSKALRPLDVNLYGGAAYEAKDLLLQDQRFLPLSIASVDYLRRGDIVVFNRSSSHPYGHISVYQGNDTEASDHIAPIARTQPYGGATVFRLRDDWSVDDLPIAVAPDFGPRSQYLADRYEPPAVPHTEPRVLPVLKSGNINAAGRNYGKLAAVRVTNLLIRRCVNVLFN